MTTSELIALPLFPLGSVLFPDGVLPLRVFEVRYLQMINQAHQVRSPFGVVALTHGSEVRVAGAETERFADVGTLAEITHYEAPQPALLRIECRGTRRFRIQERQQQKNGLWIAQVQWLPDDVAVSVPEDLQPSAQALRQVVATLATRQQEPGQEALRSPVSEPHRFDDCGWVANRWCELLPMPAELKQRLMALDSPLMRLELVGDLLTRNGITKG